MTTRAEMLRTVPPQTRQNSEILSSPLPPSADLSRAGADLLRRVSTMATGISHDSSWDDGPLLGRRGVRTGYLLWVRPPGPVRREGPAGAANIARRGRERKGSVSRPAGRRRGRSPAAAPGRPGRSVRPAATGPRAAGPPVPPAPRPGAGRA